MIENYQSIRNIVNEKSVKKENIKHYDITRPKMKDQNIKEIKLETEEEPRPYLVKKKDKLMFRKIITFKINEWLILKYNSIVESEQVVYMHDT